MPADKSAVEAIAVLAGQQGYQVGVAESLTSGQLAADLGAGPDASSWFRGGLVAYASRVKFDVLGVSPGRVVTAECARQMATGAARLLGADAVVATTGVGGPEPEEGEPAGTVFVAALVRGHETCERLDLTGTPAEVLRDTRECALRILLAAMRSAIPDAPFAASDAGPRGSG